MMVLFLEYFHVTTQVKYVLMNQPHYTREFITSVKEALKRTHPWPAYYFTSRKGSCCPPTESCIDFRELLLVLLKKATPVYIAVSDKKKLRTWADSYTRADAVRQRTLRQETTMTKTGTIPHHLYYK